MKEYKNLPDVVDKSEAELAEIFALIQRSSFPDATKDFIIKCIELARWLPLQLQNKKISLNRLRKLLFGRGYHNKNKSRNDKGKDNDVQGSGEPPSPDERDQESAAASATAESDNTSLAQAQNEDSKKKQPGHGRMAHTVYSDFTSIDVPIKGLTAGEDCPESCGGKLRNFRPGIVVRIKGQNIAHVDKYTLEKLRCDLCGLLVKATLPAAAGLEKYDASFKAMLVLQKYYIAIPFYRQEYFQKLLNFPLPDATQWDLIEQVGGCCYPVFQVIKTLAANGNLIHNDDTTLRILEVIQEIKDNPDLKRTGMYTTGLLAEYEGHQIALFINGRQHAGENLADVLAHRSPTKAPIIQMADALSSNIPKGLTTILCNCLSHGFRKFSDLVDYFPDECIKIMHLLGEVFGYDAETKAMTDTERLIYHQQHSAPVMLTLKQLINKLLDENLVEPNSELGKALNYLRRHWDKLTKFLTVAGAPLTNNIIERALKIAIRTRKSSMFYRTCYSAGIGGMLTSILYTCHLADQNAHDYLSALQQHKEHVLTHAKIWLPWNYQLTLATLQDRATNQERAPPVGCPALA